MKATMICQWYKFSYHDFVRLLASGSGNKDVAIKNCAELLKASLNRAYRDFATTDSMGDGHPRGTMSVIGRRPGASKASCGLMSPSNTLRIKMKSENIHNNGCDS
jgi:hypothetical protein